MATTAGPPSAGDPVDLQDLKEWATVRACAARQGLHAFRSDPADGPHAYFLSWHGQTRQFVDMRALRLQVVHMENEGR